MDLFRDRGMSVDDWSSIRPMCSDCSHGSPDAGHTHQPLDTGERRLGLAGSEAGIRAGLESWLTEHPEVQLVELSHLW